MIDEYLDYIHEGYIISNKTITIDFAVRKKSVKDYATKFIGRPVTVTVDRPLGSKHPKYGDRYPINYGYIKGVKAPDGEDVDAYIVGVNRPVKVFKGKCIAVIHRLDDDDDKLIVTTGKNLTDKQIRQATNFQEKYFKTEIIRGIR